MQTDHATYQYYENKGLNNMVPTSNYPAQLHERVNIAFFSFSFAFFIGREPERSQTLTSEMTLDESIQHSNPNGIIH